MLREAPHQGLTSYLYAFSERKKFSRFAGVGRTGAAWLSSARAVRRSLQWGNERNPCFVLYVSRKTALYNEEEVGMKLNQHGPLMPWATLMIQWLVQCVAKPRGGANRKKLTSVRIEGCNSPS